MRGDVHRARSYGVIGEHLEAFLRAAAGGRRGSRAPAVRGRPATGMPKPEHATLERRLKERSVIDHFYDFPASVLCQGSRVASPTTLC